LLVRSFDCTLFTNDAGVTLLLLRFAGAGLEAGFDPSLVEVLGVAFGGDEDN